MGLVDKVKEIFEDDESDHVAPEYPRENDSLLDWSASDLTDDELVDNEWIANNTKVVQ